MSNNYQDQGSGKYEGLSFSTTPQSSSKSSFTSLFLCNSQIYRSIPLNKKEWPELEAKAEQSKWCRWRHQSSFDPSHVPSIGESLVFTLLISIQRKRSKRRRIYKLASLFAAKSKKVAQFGNWSLVIENWAFGHMEQCNDLLQSQPNSSFQWTIPDVQTNLYWISCISKVTIK